MGPKWPVLFNQPAVQAIEKVECKSVGREVLGCRGGGWVRDNEIRKRLNQAVNREKSDDMPAFDLVICYRPMYIQRKRCSQHYKCTLNSLYFIYMHLGLCWVHSHSQTVFSSSTEVGSRSSKPSKPASSGSKVHKSLERRSCYIYKGGCAWNSKLHGRSPIRITLTHCIDKLTILAYVQECVAVIIKAEIPSLRTLE